jgi:fumarate hydratase subunit alpha
LVEGSLVRDIAFDRIVAAVRQLCLDANYDLPCDTRAACARAIEREESETGRDVLRLLLENAEVAKRDRVPFCQDTGYAVLFVELGQEVHVRGGALRAALDAGTRAGYCDGFLRKSLVRSPVARVNTGDNTPAVVHTEVVPGDRLRIRRLVKGAGCDNSSAIRMFTPAEGLDAAKSFVVDVVERAGPNASPPVVVGVGLGGPFAEAALLAQRALLWPVGMPNPDPELAEIEAELTARIDDLGIGPAGYGGRVTTFGVHIEAGATHIASFPVAVNLDCHSHRTGEVTL